MKEVIDPDTLTQGVFTHCAESFIWLRSCKMAPRPIPFHPPASSLIRSEKKTVLLLLFRGMSFCGFFTQRCKLWEEHGSSDQRWWVGRGWNWISTVLLARESDGDGCLRLWFSLHLESTDFALFACSWWRTSFPRKTRSRSRFRLRCGLQTTCASKTLRRLVVENCVRRVFGIQLAQINHTLHLSKCQEALCSRL